jgi:hypothetical protein
MRTTSICNSSIFGLTGEKSDWVSDQLMRFTMQERKIDTVTGGAAAIIYSFILR